MPDVVGLGAWLRAGVAGALANVSLTACHATRSASGAASATVTRPAPSSASTSEAPSPPPSSSAASATPPPAPTTAAPSRSSSPAAATPPAFAASTAPVTAAELGASWHPGCPVGPAQLRRVNLSYWGFDGAPHVGTVVVRAAVVPAIVTVFATLYGEHFPIRSMRPVSDFGGSDDASMAADNTSAFNCRYAVAPGPPSWSVHAYGEAVDVNTVENPYLEGGTVLPPAGAPYLRRTPYRPGMAVSGGELVRAFASVGWAWGGRWSASPDYQHFSATGG